MNKISRVKVLLFHFFCILLLFGCSEVGEFSEVQAAVLLPPAVAQPSMAGEIVGFNLQNTQATEHARRYVTFGQVFLAGDLAPSAGLVAKIGSESVPVQMDVKTTYPDGTVRFAIITVRAPPIAGNTTMRAMLAVGGLPRSPMNLAAALAKYRVLVTFRGGVSTTIDVSQRLADALGNGAATYWLRGADAAQARVDVPVHGSLHAIFDITAYADGTFLTEANFANDYAMQNTGGTLTYNVTIAQNRARSFVSDNLIHHQYQQWYKRVSTKKLSKLNVQHDVDYIMKTNVLQNYDTRTGIESAALTLVSYAPLGGAGINKYMPATGDRGDIGPITLANAQWLLSQDATAAKYAVAQATAAASIPWHFFDRTAGDFLSLDDYPTLWADPRGRPTLTQPIAEPSWTLDTAHQPNLSFVPYLLTGRRFHLDQINAQATFGLLWTWNAPRQDGRGIVVNDVEQVRSQAWNLRQIDDATWANPDGSAAKEYWSRILANNYRYVLVDVIPDLSSRAGTVAGYMLGAYRGDGTDRPQLGVFMQDFLVSALATSAGRGNADAAQILRWMSNWQVGRFGHGLAAAVAYVYYVGADRNSYYNSWSSLEQANGTSDTLPTDGGYWVPLGLATLANMYNVLGMQEALQYYSLVKARNVNGTNVAQYQGSYAKLNVVPVATR